MRGSGGAAYGAAEAAPRIISLSPHITELLFAAGAGDRIVGVDDASDYPAAVAGIPRVGEPASLDVEGLLKLKPTLVVLWDSGTPARRKAELRRLHLQLYVTDEHHLDDIGTTLLEFGRLAGTEAKAAAAALRYRTELAQLRQEYAARPRLRVFYQVWDRPLYTLSGRQVVSEVLSLCGGDNVFAGLPTLAPAVDKEAVLERDPDVILIAAVGARGCDRRSNGINFQPTRGAETSCVHRGPVAGGPHGAAHTARGARGVRLAGCRAGTGACRGPPVRGGEATVSNKRQCPMTFLGVSVYALVTISMGESTHGALERKTHPRFRGHRCPPSASPERISPERISPERNTSDPAVAVSPRRPTPKTSSEGGESVIAANLTIEGKIEGSGNVRMAGRFKGDVRIDGNFNIEPGAHLTGQVLAGIVVVGGELQGNIESAKRVDVQEGGIIVGDVKAGSIPWPPARACADMLNSAGRTRK